MRAGSSELVRGEPVGNVHAARLQRTVFTDLALLVEDLEVGAVLAVAQRDLVVDANGVDRARVNLAEVIDHAAQTGVVVAAEVEVAQPGRPLGVAGRNTVEVALHLCGEVVVDEGGEVLFEQAHDREGDPAWNQRLPLLRDVTAVGDRADDRRVGRGATDAEIFEALGQARLGEARRRARLVALGLGIDDSEGLTLGKLRQLDALILCAALFVFALFVREQEAGEGDDGATRGELGCRGATLRGCIGDRSTERDGVGRALRVGHLARDRALPDELVEVVVTPVELVLELTRAGKGVARGANSLVRLLCPLGFARVDARGIGNRGGTVQLCGLLARRRDRLLRERRRVGTHIGDVAVLIERLRVRHGLARAIAQLARRLLLQRRRGERRRGAAGVRLGLDREHLRRGSVS